MMKSDWRDECPGSNAGYEKGRTFYTLKTASGLYLSHPKMFCEGIPPQNVAYLCGNPPKKQIGQSQGGLTTHLDCAWVTYSLEDLRVVYKFIEAGFAKLPTPDDRPNIPCTGEFAVGKYGMGMIQGVRPLTPQERKASQAAAEKVQEHPETAGQLKFQLTRSYSGAELVNGALPTLPTSKEEKPRTTPVRMPEHEIHETEGKMSAKERIMAWKKKREGGGLNYDLPSGPKKEE